MTRAPAIWLDWSPEDFHLEPKDARPDFECVADGVMKPLHTPVDVMRLAYFQIAECVRCDKTLVRPSKAPPRFMSYRWGCWTYLIQEEP